MTGILGVIGFLTLILFIRGVLFVITDLLEQDEEE